MQRRRITMFWNAGSPVFEGRMLPSFPAMDYFVGGEAGELS
jgi:hypothetical protein